MRMASASATGRLFNNSRLYSLSEKIKKPPITGPKIILIPLNDCAKFNRKSPYLGSPSSVTYKFAAVSKNAIPLAIKNKAAKKKEYNLTSAAG